MIRHWGDREDYQDWVDRARHNPRKGEESGYLVGAPRHRRANRADVPRRMVDVAGLTCDTVLHTQQRERALRGAVRKRRYFH